MFVGGGVNVKVGEGREGVLDGITDDSVLVGMPGMFVFVGGNTVPVEPGAVLVEESGMVAVGETPESVAVGPSGIDDGIFVVSRGVIEATVEK